MRKRTIMKTIFACAFAALLLCGVSGVRTEAAKVSVVKADVTPDEPASSDLEVVQTVTKLASKRWIQSFTKDDTYYYYLQMTKSSVGHLRITRVKYTGLGKYQKDHMDLKYFGHGTNLDCSVYNGQTYLWTGSGAADDSDTSRQISCFVYEKNGVIYHNSDISYKIPKGVSGSYVTNVYPAINADSTVLAVRFTLNDKQYFQFYDLTEGTKIDVTEPLKQVIMAPTSGDFQGFDIDGSTIYTIEGSPNKVFLKSYDKSIQFKPTIIKTCNYLTGQVRSRKIKGAKRLSFREPEGIKVSATGEITIMFVSNKLTNQSCNIYRVK